MQRAKGADQTVARKSEAVNQSYTDYGRIPKAFIGSKGLDPILRAIGWIAHNWRLSPVPKLSSAIAVSHQVHEKIPDRRGTALGGAQADLTRSGLPYHPLEEWWPKRLPPIRVRSTPFGEGGRLENPPCADLCALASVRQQRRYSSHLYFRRTRSGAGGNGRPGTISVTRHRTAATQLREPTRAWTMTPAVIRTDT
jgi:hypothetical protein